MMSTLNLTVRVLNLSPKASQPDVETLFSYCGNVEKIELRRNDDDNSQSALITFVQPFAYRTALLLNDVPVDGNPIRVLPSKDLADQPDSLANSSSDTKALFEKDQMEKCSPLPRKRRVQASSASDKETAVSKAKSTISAIGKKSAKISAVIIPYAPLITALFLLSRGLYHLMRNDDGVWIKAWNSHPMN